MASTVRARCGGGRVACGERPSLAGRFVAPWPQGARRWRGGSSRGRGPAGALGRARRAKPSDGLLRRSLGKYDAYGVSVSREEERERIRQIISLLYSGAQLEAKVAKAVENGSVDRKLLAVLHHKVSGGAEGAGSDGDGGDDGDVGNGGDGAMGKALSLLYEKIHSEYQKRNISPSMQLLSDALEALLDEEGEADETKRLLRVKDLLDARFVRADLGLDPMRAAALFAEAEHDEALQREIDAYSEGRLQAATFLGEVEGRMRTLREEFAELERDERRQQQQQQRAASPSVAEGGGGAQEEGEALDTSWIEQVEVENAQRAQKRQRDKILKYMTYIIDLAKAM